jgi:myo-inositol-1-phosphate synthase
MKKKVDTVVVLWTANTEMYSADINNIEEMKQKVERDTPMASSVLFCIACIEEKVLYLNGSP